MEQNRKLRVFLCHSRDDKPKVRELYRRLVADGFDAWLDEEKLMPGQEWDLEIRKAVRESDVVVVCLSNGSVTKTGYVQKEIRFALDIADEQLEDTIFIIPARLEDCELPKRLNRWQWVNLFEDKGNEMLKQSLRLRAKSIGIILEHLFEPQIVKIPGGKFLMGSTQEQILEVVKDGSDSDWVQNEAPQHTIELTEYYIGKYPITNREYQAFVVDAKHTPPHGWDGNQFDAEKSRHPVVNVSWHDAITYCKWLSEKTGKQYRLPTEAEWEKAARGDDGYIYPWGDKFRLKNANTSETQVGSISEVGQFSPQGDSPYSCVDMVGNVWEWCNDWFQENEYKQRQGSVVKDPRGPQKGTYRVLRGGSFNRSRRAARCAAREGDHPFNMNFNMGFRVSLSFIK